VGYSHDLDSGVRFAEDNKEGESVKEIPTSAAQIRRPLPRPLFNPFDCRVKLRHESFASFGVPR
jgi:hypothetical protein